MLQARGTKCAWVTGRVATSSRTRVRRIVRPPGMTSLGVVDGRRETLGWSTPSGRVCATERLSGFLPGKCQLMFWRRLDRERLNRCRRRLAAWWPLLRIAEARRWSRSLPRRPKSAITPAWGRSNHRAAHDFTVRRIFNHECGTTSGSSCCWTPHALNRRCQGFTQSPDSPPLDFPAPRFSNKRIMTKASPRDAHDE